MKRDINSRHSHAILRQDSIKVFQITFKIQPLLRAQNVAKSPQARHVSVLHSNNIPCHPIFVHLSSLSPFRCTFGKPLQQAHSSLQAGSQEGQNQKATTTVNWIDSGRVFPRDWTERFAKDPGVFLPGAREGLLPRGICVLDCRACNFICPQDPAV